jgi:RimJ/RimL family protein N-acetyltransferase
LYVLFNEFKEYAYMIIIETPRLLLREWKPEDLESFVSINQDPRVMEFMPHLLTVKESQEFIDQIIAHFRQHGFGKFACVLKETNEFIGYVGFTVSTFETAFTPCIEISWRIGSQYWGHGYATEAARAVLDRAVSQWGLKEVVALSVPDNVRSRRVMEKLGMTHDPRENFAHPKLPKDHPLSIHVLYRIIF